MVSALRDVTFSAIGSDFTLSSSNHDGGLSPKSSILTIRRPPYALCSTLAASGVLAIRARRKPHLTPTKTGRNRKKSFRFWKPDETRTKNRKPDGNRMLPGCGQLLRAR